MSSTRRSTVSNYYLTDFPKPPPNIMLIIYADDIIICTSGPVVADLINGLKFYLSQVLNYINNKRLTVSTATSTGTLYTPVVHEYYLHSQVKLADQVLPLENKPNVLGVCYTSSSLSHTLQQCRSKSAATQ